MENNTKEGLVDQLRKVLQDGIDYLGSAFEVQQVKFTAVALTGFLFVLQILFASLLGLASFILFNVAIGMGLTLLLGNALWSVAILGTLYFLLALLLSFKALRWLKKLSS